MSHVDHHHDDEYHDDHPDHPAASDPNRVTSLCISRKTGEGITFYGPVHRLEVNRITPNVVRLIVHAPRSTKVLRDEIVEAAV